MKKYTFLLLGVCFIVCCNCCKKTEALPKLPLDNIVQNYVVFNINSYWVYLNKNNLQKDTIKITRTELWGYRAENLGYSYSLYDADYYSTHKKQKLYSRAEARHMNESFCNYNMWFENAITSAKCTFFSNRSVGSTYNYWYYPDNIVTYQEFLPTYTLEGKVYTDVMAFESRYTGASVPFDDVRLPVKVWYAKHVGIIRKEMKNGEIWNLISYDVKQ